MTRKREVAAREQRYFEVKAMIAALEDGEPVEGMSDDARAEAIAKLKAEACAIIDATVDARPDLFVRLANGNIALRDCVNTTLQ
jgi:hypothetical protein